MIVPTNDDDDDDVRRLSRRNAVVFVRRLPKHANRKQMVVVHCKARVVQSLGLKHL